MYPDEVNKYLLKHALAYYGTSEIPGSKGNPAIVSFLRFIGFKTKDDQISWCSAFMHYLAAQISAEAPATKKGLARSWLTVGEEIALEDAHPGDVVIFRRGTKSWQGHVGILVRHDGSRIWTLGGNQKNMVCISAYKTSALLGVRRLRPASQMLCEG